MVDTPRQVLKRPLRKSKKAP
ncbi:hypothetical protein M3J09_010075 [Ascochyta lentis]